MNALAAFLVFVCAIGLLSAPRKWAPLPLLLGCCYLTLAQRVEIGPVSLPAFRILLFSGLIRVLIRGERIERRANTVDYLVLIWGVWMFIASLAHEKAAGSGPLFASGIIFNVWLVYYLVSVFCRKTEDAVDLVKVLAVVLFPVALEMVQEKLTGKNLFSFLGGVAPEVLVREGKRRAQAAFGNPILAGTIGSVCLPLFIGIWSRHKRSAFLGVGACCVMIVASASSGPILSALCGLFAVSVWRFRSYTGYLRLLAVLLYIGLELVMTRPAIYLISKIDLAGGSTSWYRARLLDSAFEHLSEWWAFGTDRTRHWMPTGIGWSDYHTDITSYYIQFGVWAGILGLALLVLILWYSFRYVGEGLKNLPERSTGEHYFLWCTGAGVFTHAATSLSVSYFDQSQVFFWLNVAAVGSLSARAQTPLAEVSSVAPEPYSVVTEE